MEMKQISLTIPVPKFSIADRIVYLKNLLVKLYGSVSIQIKTGVSSIWFFVKRLFSKLQPNREGLNYISSQPKQRLEPRKVLKFVGLIAVSVLVLIGGYRLLRSISSGSSNTDQRAQVQGAKANQDINKDYTFSIKDSSGEKEITKFKYTVESAELRDEIVVKGQRATSVKGRTFLIVNLRISNDYTSGINVNTRNYIRLSVNGNDSEWLAPDIHNDPVEVQAQSTKLTRLGFPINDVDKKLVLQVGEIGGDKEKIELDLNGR